MNTPRTLGRDAEVFSWSLEAAPDIVRDFDWEDGEARSPATWAVSALVPPVALVAATTVALRGGIL